MTGTRHPGPNRPILDRLAGERRAGLLDRRTFMALASTFGAGAAIGRPAIAQTPAGRPGGTLRVAMRVMDIADPRRFDWTEKGNLARQFCEPLVRWNADYGFTGELLEGWHVSDDARTYLLRLRRGVTWTNGDIFTADDVIHNIARWCDTTVEGNSMATRMASLIDAGTGRLADGAVTRIDDNTVRLTLSRPDITLIASMADYPALIVHRSHGDDTDLSQRPIGTGPFQLVSLTPGNRAELRRRTGTWWGGAVWLDGIRFIDPGVAPADLAVAFEAGQVDMTDETPPQMIATLDKLGLVKAAIPTAGTVVARMRMDTAPYTDKALRNAIQMAVDNTTVLDLGIGGNGIPAENHHVAPFHPEYAAIPTPRTDPAAAFAMASAAGHAETAIELFSVEGDWRATTADAIGAMLDAAGFTLERTTISASAFWNDWTKYPFSITNWAPRPLGIQVLSLAYRTGAPWNETGHSDPDFDALLDRAAGIFDAEAWRGIFAELQTRLQDSGVIVQPYWRNLTLHHAAGVMGLRIHPGGCLHLANVWLDI
ncbi:MAG: ABC transporter substrate-binding protein [Roseovarius sp.]